MQPPLRPLSRRTLLKGAGAAVVGSALFTDEHTPAGGGSTTRYVSVFGSDSGAGTEAAPWRSLARVRAALRKGELRRGDAVLLKRGDTFFGSLHEPSILGAAGVFTVGAYGTGPRPKVSGYKISKAAWSQHAKGIWKLDITARSGQYRGNTAAPSTNVGFLKVAGLIRGWKRTSVEALENQWDFYSDEAFLYVRSSFAPGDGVAIAVQQDGVRPASHSILDGIHIEGHGAHGIATGGSENIRVRNCRLEDLGGSQLASDGTRYGNGVEVWIGASNIVIENSTIRECYDVAFTMQGTASKEAKAWTDIHFRNNRVENCNQTFEMWSAGEATPGSGHIRCKFNHNICMNAGYSWAATLRPDREGKGTHILTYDTELPMDVEVTRNQFIGARDSYINISGDKKAPKGLNLHHNIIKLGPGTKTAYGSAETIELAERWQARTGKEHGSIFGVLTTGRCEAQA